MVRLTAGMRTTELAVQAGADPAKAARRVAIFHRTAVAEAREQNRRVLGTSPPGEVTTVDGKRGAPLESVKLDGGRISTLFPTYLIGEILEYIDFLLISRSPIGPEGGAGTYNRSHRLFADGTETDPATPKLDANEWVFISTLPYSRKIERGQGKSPKEGVYQGAAALANQKFGNIARIRFTFDDVAGTGRFPAIRIRLL